MLQWMPKVVSSKEGRKTSQLHPPLWAQPTTKVTKLSPRVEVQEWPQLIKVLEPVQIGLSTKQVMFVGTSLPKTLKGWLKNLLKENAYLFA